MKKYITIFSLLFIFACSEDFLDRPPEDSFTTGNFYTTPDQLLSTSTYLYAHTWFDYIDKAAVGIHDVMGGNGRTSDDNIARFLNFSLTADYTQIRFAWQSFFATIAHANSMIINIENGAGSSIESSIRQSVLGEGHFFRAISYFYLVRLWGPVPIIEDNSRYTRDPRVPKAPVDDVFRFIISDLEEAIEKLPDQQNSPDRVDAYSAKALMAQVYLHKATISGSDEDYAMAAQYAGDVIQNSHYALVPDYSDLWHPDNNNNVESIFALQWFACQNDWGTQNSLQAYFAADGTLTEAGDGWGTVTPTIDLINSFANNDLRRPATLMEDGNFYPTIWTDRGGYTYSRYENGNLKSNTGANIKKHVVGTNKDAEVCFMSTGLNTPLIRYADVLLTFAEATIGNANSTTNAEALEAFNQVRVRAGLPTVSQITLEDIMEERRHEFAFEFQAWFDILRMYNRDQQSTIEFIAEQERGIIGTEGGNEVVLEEKYAPSPENFVLPMPANDAAANPLLLEEPVPYYND